MIAGLIVSALLCPAAEPPGNPGQLKPESAPGMTENHRDALSKYGAAIWNLRRERLLSAAKQLESAAKADPQSTAAQKELVKLYAQLGREPEAIRIARKVLDKNPDDYDTGALLARLLFDAGEPKEAVATAKIAMESSSLAEKPATAVRIYRELAVICEKAHDLNAAEDALRKAVELVTEKRSAVIEALAFTPKEADGEAADCLERLGNILVKRAKFDPATEAYTAAAKLYADPKRVDDPDRAARLGWNLSGVLEAKGEPEAAIKQLKQYLQLQPRSSEPYQRLARLLRAASRDDEILQTLQRYVDNDKRNRPLAAVLAAEMARDRDPLTRQSADELFDTITSVTVEPEVMAVVVHSRLRSRRAIEIIKDLDRAFSVLNDEKKKDKGNDEKNKITVDAAAEAVKKRFAAEKARAIAAALENEPDGVAAILRAAGDDLQAGHKRSHGTYFFLGSLAAQHHQLELAILQFRHAVRLAPRKTQNEAYSALIHVYQLAHRPVEIERLCREVLSQGDPFKAEAFFNYYLSGALAQQGKAEAAIIVADKTIQQAGTDDALQVRLNKHRILCLLGRWNEAIEYGQKLLDEFDSRENRPRVRYAQASAYSGAKKPLEAEKLLRAILDDDPDNSTACNDLGYNLADQGRNLDEAERLIRHAITVDRIERRKAGSPESESAAYIDSLGWVLFRRGKLTEAKAELEKATKMAEGAADPTVWDHLGDVLFRLHDKPNARAAWEKARELYDANGRLSSSGRRDNRMEEVKRKLKLVQRQ